MAATAKSIANAAKHCQYQPGRMGWSLLVALQPLLSTMPDGNRVKGTVNGVATVYTAGLYEYQSGATTLYSAPRLGSLFLLLNLRPVV